MAVRNTFRLHSIDALRGLVILFMLLDHVRETFYLHRQVTDPMDVATTEPGLFLMRTLAHLCAPVFVLLTGLSAWLYGAKHESRHAVSAFLFKRGLFLIVLELTVVNFAWTFQWPPTVIYLQVIWAIGLSMLALAALVWLPRAALLIVAAVLIGGHNLLDAVHAAPDSIWHAPWAVLHDRGWLQIGEALRLRTSYPLLPWIGIIALGYALGPWFASSYSAPQRQRQLLLAGVLALLGFIVLRALNGYGEAPWAAQPDLSSTLMSLFNITKYPPSLGFLLLTLGLGLCLLHALERLGDSRWLAGLVVFGAAPMFVYVLHLYVLKAAYLMAVAVLGRNQGEYFGFDGTGAVWLTAGGLALALYLPVKAFASFKARRRDLAWLKYC